MRRAQLTGMVCRSQYDEYDGTRPAATDPRLPRGAPSASRRPSLLPANPAGQAAVHSIDRWAMLRTHGYSAQFPAFAHKLTINYTFFTSMAARPISRPAGTKKRLLDSYFFATAFVSKWLVRK